MKNTFLTPFQQWGVGIMGTVLVATVTTHIQNPGFLKASLLAQNTAKTTITQTKKPAEKLKPAAVRQVTVAEAIALLAKGLSVDPKLRPVSLVGNRLPNSVKSSAVALEKKGVDLDKILGKKKAGDVITKDETAKILRQLFNLSESNVEGLNDPSGLDKDSMEKWISNARQGKVGITPPAFRPKDEQKGITDPAFRQGDDQGKKGITDPAFRPTNNQGQRGITDPAFRPNGGQNSITDPAFTPANDQNPQGITDPAF